MKKWTLQVRLTVFVGVILFSVCLLLTVNSLFAANAYYGNYAMLIESGQAEPDPAWYEADRFDPGLVSPGEFYQEASQRFSAQSLTAMVFLVVLSVGCTYWTAGRILRPLKKLTESVHVVDDLHLDHRVVTEGAKGEVLALTESFNGMLDRLERSFSIQKRFAANAAHELKTPLAVIKSSLQVLEMSPHPQEEDYREFMADTGESLERIIHTVEELLSLTDLEAALVGETVELRTLLDQAVRELSGMAKEYGVTFTVSGQAPPVRGNASLLYRAVFNLIENAIKYNRPGGTAAVSLEQSQAGICIRIEDTGIGIEADALSHIFEPFYRADPSRSQQIPGSGLGLSVVKLIVERHGGKIEVTSQTDSGSTFSIMLIR
ncbi:HAMP domain-containing histidine kinase [Lacrimispora sp. NSJ-141]|uniref:histidine kinase n=1 Tax=Lientehia hominis TaxID=2897778 RepID=A0AAP2RGI3_9FIRM|nr:HAMP domain-containing sensor histidine kinase [Lientehia hominis]MCD2491747.1 HAMP domain-containing histidine kinase [Lientehia hominis]